MSYSLTKATSWNLAGYTYLILASFFSVPILVNSLGVTAFSHYALALATLAVASSFDLGLSAAVIRLLARNDHTDHHSIWSTSLTLFFVTGVVAASMATFAVSRIGLSPSLFPIIFFHTLATHILAHYLTLPQAHGRFDLYNLRTFIVGTANTLIAAFLASSGYGIDVLLITQLIASVITISILTHYSHHHFHLPPVRPSRIHSRRLLGFGIKNQAGKLMGQVGAQYAKFLLAPVSAIAVTAYSIAQGVVLKLAGGLTQLSTALYPASSAHAQSKKLQQTYHRLQLVILALSVTGLALYFTFGLRFLTWWLTDLTLVSSVHSILTLLIPYLAVLMLTPLASTILDSHNRPGLTSLFTTLTIALEITLALILLPSRGLLAPPIAALVSVVLTTPALLIVTDRTLRSKVK